MCSYLDGNMYLAPEFHGDTQKPLRKSSFERTTYGNVGDQFNHLNRTGVATKRCGRRATMRNTEAVMQNKDNNMENREARKKPNSYRNQDRNTTRETTLKLNRSEATN